MIVSVHFDDLICNIMRLEKRYLQVYLFFFLSILTLDKKKFVTFLVLTECRESTYEYFQGKFNSVLNLELCLPLSYEFRKDFTSSTLISSVRISQRMGS